MSSILNDAYFHVEREGFATLEASLWPNGRTTRALHGIIGRRLSYQNSSDVRS